VSRGADEPLAGSGLERLTRRALSLAAANALDYALQLLLPVVLVRQLTPADVGGYRLLWLVAGTVMAVVTETMAGSLYYFLPRSDRTAKRLYINQTLLYLTAAGLLAAWAVSGFDPWLPGTVRALSHPEGLLPAFVLLWVIGSLLDLIGSAEERIAWQAKTTIGLSLLRAVTLSMVALLTRRLEPVLLALLGFVAFKVVVLLGYVARYHGLRGPFLRKEAFAEQLRQSAPFGLAGALYGLRAQSDQWVATALFSMGSFASLSIAALLAPVVHVCRKSVLQVFLPGVSRLQAAGDLPGMLELNSQGNVMVAALVYPLLVFAFTFSDDLVTIVFTATYANAAAVMRVYIVGMFALVVEVATLRLLLRQGGFSVALSVVALVFSVAISWWSAHAFGLAGAALGSVSAIYLELLGTLWRISHLTGIPMRKLQNWRSLALLSLCAVLAGSVAWAVVREVLESSAPLVRATTGAAVLGLAYLAMLALSGMGRSWRPVLEGVRGALMRSAGP
jgi:O-antigen/teichoic acid export membrane protein